jgi:putative transcriptional regulator
MAKRKYNRIKAILAEQGKSNKELAALLDLSERTVSRWSTNGRQPSVEMLYEIAKVLKVEVRELLVGSGK